MITDKKVSIILLNFNTWEYTIECLESILKSNYKNYHIIVVDNNSWNNSLDYMMSWAEGKLSSYVPKNNKLRNLSFPPTEKPIQYNNFIEEDGELKVSGDYKREPVISFIQNSRNYGFSVGYNIGIRFALNRIESDYVWVLNNDTVIEENTLANSVQYVSEAAKDKGIFGSVLKNYYKPSEVQTIGGKIYSFCGHIKNIEEIDKFSQVHYISGASMLISREFLERVGLFSEDYFLYFEEIDLIKRGKKLGFGFDLCRESIVYHVEGASTGLSRTVKKRSILSDYYGLRSRLSFTKKFYPIYLPIVIIFSLSLIIKRTICNFKFLSSLIKLHYKQRGNYKKNRDKNKVRI